MKKFKNEGITLIALVVTIIVLLILAGVSIAMLSGDNGIITKARQAKEAHDESSENETTEMEDTANKINQYDPSGGSSSDNEKITLPEGWDGNKVNPVKSADDVIVPVPKGYVPSTVENENKVSTGLVIKEGDNGGLTEGINEFVWVPVSDISDIYDEANQAGQLWDFESKTAPNNVAVKRTYPTSRYSSSIYKEPDVVTNQDSFEDSVGGSKYDAINSYLQQAGLSSTATASDFKTQLQSEFNEMIESVRKYGGFYIGRYETGNLSQEKAVVQKNNSDIGSQTWYTQYKKNKEIKANDNVITSMIWGCQWDATLRWMQSSPDEEVASFPSNSEGKGNYYQTQNGTSKIIPTGSNSNYAVNNIYDMAGNVFDWTLEAYPTDMRTIRGGRYNSTPTVNPAGGRYGFAKPDNGYETEGSRCALYIS